MTPRQQLYQAAKDCLGLDMIEDPTVDISVGCAESVNAVFKKAFGREIGGGASTAAMYAVLQKDPRFKLVNEPIPGDIIISPTGTSSKKAPHGHVGLVGYHGIMSNNSMTGTWQEYYTLESWKEYYQDRLGFPVLYFQVI